MNHELPKRFSVWFQKANTYATGWEQDTEHFHFISEVNQKVKELNTCLSTQEIVVRYGAVPIYIREGKKVLKNKLNLVGVI